MTNRANINKILLEIPQSLKIFNSFLNLSNNLLFKILNMGDESYYKVNEGYINLRPFKNLININIFNYNNLKLPSIVVLELFFVFFLF